MQAFDTSSMIYAWFHYPAAQFPGIWNWMDEQMDAKTFVISEVAFDEVQSKVPNCAKRLKENSIHRYPTSAKTLQIASGIKSHLGIQNDWYGSGVGENDILIIASAKEHGLELVSEEARQPNLPKDLKKCKIPAVCGMAQVGVHCVNFRDIFTRSGKVFG